MTRFKIVFTITLFAALMASFTVSLAQSDTLVLEEILVTAKSASSLSKTNINGTTLQFENPHDGGAMFINQAGFGVEKRGNYGMEPVLRGFKYSQLNVLIDGGVNSTNACPNRMDPTISQVAPEEIEKIEVIKGPFSVRYGQTFGGIINIVNRKPDRSAGKTFSGTLEGGYQSNGGNLYTNLFTQVVAGKTDLSLNFGYKDYGNYKSGSGQEIASSFNRLGYAMKLGYQFSADQRLQITWRQSMAKDVLYAGLPMDADKDNSSILSADYAINNLSPVLKSLKLKAYGSYVDHEMSNTRRPAYAAAHAVSPVNATVLGGRTEFGLQTSGANFLYAGVDFKHIGKDGVRNRLVFKNTCTGATFDPPKAFVDKTWQDSNQDDLGVFLENKRTLNENMVWTLGIRSDVNMYSIHDPDAGFLEQYNNEIKPDDHLDISATTSLTWFLPKNTNLYFALARSTRAPELSELFINHLSIGMDAYEYIGNPDLLSEVNYQFDVRLEKKMAQVGFFADVYYAYINNYITAVVDETIPRVYTPCNDPKFTKQFRNADEVFLTGFEAGFNWEIGPSLQYDLVVSYVYGQNISWDEPLAEITPLTTATSLAYTHNKFRAEIHGRVVDAQNRVASSFDESKTPGFAVFDIYANYSFFNKLDVALGVKNLFDKNYVEHLSRAYKAMDIQSLYFEPGRSINISLKYRF